MSKFAQWIATQKLKLLWIPMTGLWLYGCQSDSTSQNDDVVDESVLQGTEKLHVPTGDSLMALFRTDAPDPAPNADEPPAEPTPTDPPVTPPPPPTSRQRIEMGANRLASLQADTIGDNAGNGYTDEDPDDGGWDFDLPSASTQHTATTSPENTYGVTAIGSLSSYMLSKNPRFLMSALDAYTGIERRPEADSPPDFAFLCFLSVVTGNKGFCELARARYDAKVLEGGGAQAWGESIVNARGAAGADGLIAFDLGWLVLATVALDYAFPGQGYFAQSQIYGGLVLNQIDFRNESAYFKILDPTEPYYVIGLAWASTALIWSRVSPARAALLRNLLLRAQLPNGGWYWNETQGVGELQSTAAAVQALSALPSTMVAVQDAALRGRRFLHRQQQTSGGWQSDSELLLENTEFDSEILFALFLVRRGGIAPFIVIEKEPTPEPQETPQAPTPATQSAAPAAPAASPSH